MSPRPTRCTSQTCEPAASNKIEPPGKGSINHVRNVLPPRISRSECAGPRAAGVGGQQPAAVLAADDGPRRRSTSESARKLTERGIAFLRPRQDAKGGWSTQREPGITALVVTALLRSGQVAPGEPVVTKALAYLEGFIGPKGGLSEAPHANYSTSIALLAFQEANAKGRYDRTIKAGQEFLKSMQWDESEGKTRDDAFYGGAGYGGSQQPARPVEHRVLHRSPARNGLARRRSQLAKGDRLRLAVPEPEERVQRPAVGVQGQRRRFRLHGRQRRAEHGRQSRADGGLRSYASMTYAGLKSMIYAGLDARRPARQGRPHLHHPALHAR